MAKGVLSRSRTGDLFGPQLPAGVEEMDDAVLIPLPLLSPNPFQPRREFDPTALTELATSLGQVGVLQPLLLRQMPGDDESYQIAAGERRWRAAQIAGLDAVPCLVRDLNDEAMEMIALVENIQRDDLSPLDEARAYRRLMDRLGLSMRALSERLSKSHTFVENRLKLVSDPRIEAAVASGAVGATVAAEIADLEDVARDALLARADRGERIKVKDVQAANPRPRSSGVANYLPVAPKPQGEMDIPQTPPSTPASTVTPTITMPPATRIEPVRDTTPRPGEGREGAGHTHDMPAATVVGARPSATRRPTGHNWVASGDTQTGTLFEVGGGYADREQLRAALWADLEALDG